jgi:hypothetical protein
MLTLLPPLPLLPPLLLRSRRWWSVPLSETTAPGCEPCSAPLALALLLVSPGPHAAPGTLHSTPNTMHSKMMVGL